MPDDPQRPRRLGYLSAAPTVSTRLDAASAGPRAHINGVMSGFRAAAWEVEPFIVGDRMPKGMTDGGVQRRLERSRLLRMAADAARLVMARRNAARAWSEIGGEVDWVYERFATMQVLGRRFQRAGIPWILETQGLFYYESEVERASVGLPWLAKRIEKAAYRACDALVCVTPSLRDLIVRECGVSPSKILVVPNAVELERFESAVREPAERFFKELTIGFVGGLIGWQALDRLIDAIADLETHEGIRIALVVAGDGAMREAWQKRAEMRGIATRVRFLGHLAGHEVPRTIAGCDIGYAGAEIMRIGRMYHSPIKLYEYMAAARPVLAAAFDDARALVEGKGTGFLFEAGDTLSLEHALRTVHEARGRLPEMGRRARTLIETEHSWQARTRAMIDTLEQRLDGRVAHRQPHDLVPARA